MATQSIGVRIALEGAGEYIRNIKTATAETKALKSELELASRLKNPFERATSMKSVLTSEIAAQEEKIKLLADAYNTAEESTGKFSEKTLKARDALDKAEIALDSMKRQLADLPNGLEMAGDDLLKAGDRWSSAGNEFKQAARPFWGATGAAVAGIGAAAKITMSFEQQMATVKAVTNATTEQLEEMSAKARQVGADTKFTATEAAQALEILGRAGFDPYQSISMVDSVMALAAADAISLDEAAGVISNTMKTFGMETHDAAENLKNSANVADVWAQASRSANTNTLELAEAAKYAAPSFSALGWSVEDLAFALDLAAEYGVKGSQAGTGYRQMLVQLEKPTDAVAAAMERYGITLDDGTGKAVTYAQFLEQLRGAFGNLEVDVYDVSGELKDGEAIMQEYADSLPITQMEMLNAIATLFGTRALPEVIAQIQTSDEKFESLKEKIYNANGAAKEMQDIMIDTAEGQMTILISKLQELALSFGEIIIPVLKDVIDIAQQFVDWLNQMDDGTRKLILKSALIVGAVAPVLTAFGSLFTGMGSIISVGGHLFKGMGQIIKLTTGGGGFLSSMLAAKGGMDAATGAAGLLSGAKGIGSIIATAGPYAAAIGLVITAGVLLYKNWDEIKEAGKVLAERLGEHASNIRENLSEAWEAVKTKTSEVWGTIKEAVGTAFDDVVGKASGLVSNIAGVLSGAGGISAVKTAAENLAGAIGGAITSKLSAAAETANKFLGGLVKSATSWGGDIAKNLSTGLENKVSTIKSAVTNAASTIKKRLGFSEPEEGPLSDFHTYMPDMMALMAKGIRDNLPVLRDAVNQAAYAMLPPTPYMDLPDTGYNSNTTNMGGVQIVINQQPGQDADELAEILEQKLVALEERRMYAYGTT